MAPESTKRGRRLLGTLFMGIGVLAIAAAAALLLYNLRENERAGDAASQELQILQEQLAEQAASASEDGSAEPFSGYDEVVEWLEVNGTDYAGYLTIPALDLQLPVFSEWSYENLKNAPCRYSGSVFSDDLVICGHNYEKHFGRLKNLSLGDAVYFTGVDGETRTYEVAALETVDAAAIEYVTDSSYELTLYTCNYDGTRRVTVRCSLT